MSSRRFLLVVDAPALPPQIEVGPEFANRWVDLATLRATTAGQDSKLIELTSDQWQFLRGVYAMNPLTPPGLPYGDRAALARFDELPNGIVFFIDGDRACTPMTVPDELLSMMDDVATARISHEGSAL
jgi:hypothetical protein